MRLRTIVVTLAVLTVGYLGLTFWVGGRSLKVYEEQFAQQFASPAYEILAHEQRRGLFSSTVRSTVLVRLGSREVAQLEESDILYHGPLPLMAIGKGMIPFRLAPVVMESQGRLALLLGGFEESERIQGEAPLLQAVTVGHWDGTATSQWEIASAGWRSALGDLTFSGVKGELEWKPTSKQVACQLQLPAIEGEMMGVRFALTGFSYQGDFDYSRSLAGAPVTHSQYSFEKACLALDDELGGSALSLSDMETGGGWHFEGDTLAVQSDIQCGKMELNSVAFGPFSWKIQARNLDAAVCEEVYQLYYQSLADGSFASDPTSFFKQINGLLPAFIAARPEFEVSYLSAETVLGRVEGKALVTLDAAGLNQDGVCYNLPLLLDRVRLDAYCSVAKPLLDMAILFDALGAEAKEFMVERGDDYEVTLQFDGHGLLINGEPARNVASQSSQSSETNGSTVDAN